ncbi:MAG: GxGYxYP domain-containing protein [Armatimonadota bacterium]
MIIACPLLTVLTACVVSSSSQTAQPIVLFPLWHHGSLNLDDLRQREKAFDEAHLVACLQGIVNRGGPRLYLDAIHDGGRSIDLYWLDKLTKPGGWLHGRGLERIDSLEALIRRFRRSVRGVVVWDPSVPATSNAASTAAGCENLLPIRYDRDPDSLFSRLVLSGPKLPVKVWLVSRDGTSMFTGTGTVPGTSRRSMGSAKADVYVWAIERYLKPGRCSDRHLAYYIDGAWLANPRAGGSVWNHTLTNHDYFVARRAFFFDLSPWDDEPATDDPSQPLGTDVAVLKEILLTVYRNNGGRKMCHIGGFVPWAFKYTDAAGGKHEGVPSEWRFSEIISAYNAYLDADALGIGAMANASFYAHYPLKPRYVQPNPAASVEDLKRRGFIREDGTVVPRRYVAFYVGDFDSAAWLYRMVPQLWDHPDRGKVPLSWAFNPNLADRAAPAMVYTRETASSNDFFIAGDSGAGYINPGLLEPPRRWSTLPSGTDTWLKHCRAYYRQWDLRVTGFIIDGYAPPMPKAVLDAYVQFSPQGIVAQKVPPLSMHKGMPVIRMDYDLTQGPAESAKVLLSRLGGDLSGPPAEPSFHVFRAILKTPCWYRELVEAVLAGRPNAAVTVVDMPTLMALAKLWLEKQQTAP